MACLFALPVIVFLAGGRNAPPVLLWIIGISWLQIISDVLLADLTRDSIVDDPSGSARELAILFSLCAICTVALGMRSGNWFGKRVFQSGRRAMMQPGNSDEAHLPVRRLVGCYIGMLVVMQALNMLAQAAPAVLQPVVVIGSLKYVLVYLIAVTVLESEQNYLWLVLVAGLEIVTGVISYFSSYKESIFIILIAIASSRRPIRLRNLALAAIALVGVIWLSLVWTVIKIEYRTVMSSMSFTQKIDYMAEKYLSTDIDYEYSLEKLASRIGYTRLYAKVIAKEQVGSLPQGFDYYKGAVWHILTPRIFFSDKPVLDDSRGTTQLLGLPIAPGTSVGVGYVAQAQVDFGFPGLLLPMWIIGTLLGLCWQYFATRPVHRLLAEGFGVAALFLSFQFGENIDKALGALVTVWIGLALILRFAYPAIRFLLAIPPHDAVLPASGSAARARP
jgi:hypothetical protein